MFPTWEQNIPNVGTKYSQRGNKVFLSRIHYEPYFDTSSFFCLFSFFRARFRNFVV